MPKFLEDKLKAEYGSDSAMPYKVTNKIGAMRGNKETAKGRQMEAKHEHDTKKARKPSATTESHAFNWRNRHGQTKVGMRP